MRTIPFGIKQDIHSIRHSFRIRTKGMTAEDKNESKEIEEKMMRAAQLFRLIDSEVQPVLEKEREAHDRLTKKHSLDPQGYSADLDKYQNFATLRPGKIEKEFDSDSNGAMFARGMNKAESDSRNAAGAIN